MRTERIVLGRITLNGTPLQSDKKHEPLLRVSLPLSLIMDFYSLDSSLNPPKPTYQKRDDGSERLTNGQQILKAGVQAFIIGTLKTAVEKKSITIVVTEETPETETEETPETETETVKSETEKPKPKK